MTSLYGQHFLVHQWDNSDESDDSDELAYGDINWRRSRGMHQPSRGRWRGRNRRRGGVGRGFPQCGQSAETTAFAIFRGGGISTRGRMREYEEGGGIVEVCNQVSGLNLNTRKGSAVPAHVENQSVRQQAHNACSEISVASYNVLAQCYIEEMADQLYQHCPPRFLAWSYRRTQIIRQLEINKPDIICLQEVQLNHYHEFFCPRLHRLGYEGHYKQRTGNKKDGCATFYKRDKFTCPNAVPVEFHVAGCPLLDRDNVALLVLLSPRHPTTTGSCFICVANTHLLYNPRRGDVKLAQMMFLLAAIDEVAAQTRNHPQPRHDPVILCGDMNCQPHSELFSFLVDGQLDYDGGVFVQTMSGQLELNGRANCLDVDFLPEDLDLTYQCQFVDLMNYRLRKQREAGRGRNRKPCRNDSLALCGTGCVSHNFNFHSAYRHDDSGSFTAWLSNPPGGAVIDYICYANDENCPRGERLELVNVLSLPKLRDIWASGGLPNENQPSDHLMLMATFAFKHH